MILPPNKGSITVITQPGKCLSKQLLPDGTTAHADNISDATFITYQWTLEELAQALDVVQANQVWMSSVSASGLSQGNIASRAKATEYHKAGHHLVQTRTAGSWLHPSPCFNCLDFDYDQAPDNIRNTDILPVLQSLVGAPFGYVRRLSTSSNVFDQNGQPVGSKSAGSHIYVMAGHNIVIDLFDRLLLAGYGFPFITSNGNVLVRTPLDLTVRAPTSLHFEGPLQLPAGYRQDRKAEYVPGGGISLLFLTLEQQQQVSSIKIQIKAAGETLAAPIRAAIADKLGMTQSDYSLMLEKRSVYLPATFTITLADGTEATSADIYANPDQYKGKGVKDPLEPDYDSIGRFYVNPDGSIIISSLAHGIQTSYLLGKPVDVGAEMIAAILNGDIELQPSAGGIDFNMPEHVEPGSDYKPDLLKHVPGGHLMKRYAINVSKATDIPVNTIFMVGLSTASSAILRTRRFNYPDGDELSLGLYFIGEQPPGTAKSRALKAFQNAIFAQEIAYKRWAKEETRRLLAQGAMKQGPKKGEPNEADEGLKALIKPPFFLSNATPEGIEKNLEKSGGYFSLVSAEQGLVDVLFGLTYGDSKPGASSSNNNDLVLKGFTGEYFSSARATRVGYCGDIYASICSFAQPGVTEKVISSSNGSGVVERFSMLSEPHRLGKRDLLNREDIDPTLKAEYFEMMKPHTTRALPTISIPFGPTAATPLAPLPPLVLCKNGWELILDYQQSLEEHLADGADYSSNSLRGAAAKIDINIIKFSCILYLTQHLPFEDVDQLSNVVPLEYVQMGIGLADELLTSNRSMSLRKRIIGHGAEADAVLDWFERKNNKAFPLRTITQAMRSRKPFTDLEEGVTAAASKAIKKMLKDGLLEEVSINEKPLLRVK